MSFPCKVYTYISFFAYNLASWKVTNYLLFELAININIFHIFSSIISISLGKKSIPNHEATLLIWQQLVLIEKADRFFFLNSLTDLTAFLKSR